MRINKLVGVGLLVVVLAIGSMVAGFAATDTDTADVTANFTIPSYIAIYAVGNPGTLTDASSDPVSGPGTYDATSDLYVVSTKAWSVDSTVVWGTSPAEGGKNLFTVTYTGDSKTPGWDAFTATYTLDLSAAVGDNGEGNAMRYFPAGEYIITVTHTATTNAGGS